MVNPVSSAASIFADHAAQAAVRQPKPQPQQSTEVQDKVTLKSTGDVDHDGDSK
jgi:hypothetical protein